METLIKLRSVAFAVGSGAAPSPSLDFIRFVIKRKNKRELRKDSEKWLGRCAASAAPPRSRRHCRKNKMAAGDAQKRRHKKRKVVHELLFCDERKAKFSVSYGFIDWMLPTLSRDLFLFYFSYRVWRSNVDRSKSFQQG